MSRISAVSKQNNLPTETISQKEPIAIVGIGCRFPGGVDSPAKFWALLRDGVNVVTEIPSDRIDIDTYYDPRPATAGRMMTRWGGFLKDIDKFDAGFFGISPREAERLDPQQRLLLEVAWEALEDAAVVPGQLKGSQSGVFVGLWLNDFESRLFANPEAVDFYMTTGSGRYSASGRISYVLGLQGPSITVDTACSSSLVAIHLACQSLWMGESTLALAGGANVILQPHISIAYSQSQMMAPDGLCKFGDAHADGYVRSEGAALVVLKPLSRAIEDHDPIYALIRGGAVNNDGQSSGFLATPGQEGQAEMLRLAYRNAGIDPRKVRYIEAHGTGTRAGDPVELGALGAVIGVDRSTTDKCLVGSVKTNFGHTEGAAGIAGLVKVALALKHRQIPPSLHLKSFNPDIPWDRLGMTIPTTLTPWPTAEEAIAGVSAFGIAGTNAHIVLSEWNESSRDEFGGGTAQSYPLALSAQSSEALTDLARSFANLLVQEDPPSLSDICYTADCRRTHHLERLAAVGKSHQELADRLSAYIEQQPNNDAFANGQKIGERANIVFVFPGQGGQWLGMGRELLRENQAFREALQECEQAIRRWTDWSLLEQLSLSEDSPGYRLNEIGVIQPTLFAIEVALAAVWRSWGVEPAAVIGHSMGEVAAAYVAGALNITDAARVICKRSQLMQRTSGQGAMAVVGLSFADAEAVLKGYEDRLSIAVHNSPRSVVLSGEPKALETVLNGLRAKEIFCRAVKVDVASHSPQMDPLRPELVSSLKGIKAQTTSTPFYSTVTQEITDGAMLDMEYWGKNLRQPVQFGSMIQKLIDTDHSVFIEMSPHPILLGAIQEVAAERNKPAYGFASTRRDQPEMPTLLGELGTLYSLGYSVDWNKFFPSGGRVVSLPAYPWQRERYWLETASASAGFITAQFGPRQQQHPILGRRVELASQNDSTTWEFSLTDRRFPYLYDHRLQGASILAASNYLEMMLAAAKSVYDGQPAILNAVEFERALVLPNDRSSVPMQLNLAPASVGHGLDIQIFSRTGDSWTRHVVGGINIAADRSAPQPFELKEIQSRCTKHVDRQAFYTTLEHMGIEIGSAAQGIQRASYGSDELLAFAELDDRLMHIRNDHPRHLAALEACMQLSAGAVSSLSNAPADSTPHNILYIPTRLDRVQVFKDFPSRLWMHVQVQDSADAHARSLVEDIRLYDEDGAAVAELIGLHLKPLESELEDSIPHNIADWFYTIQWDIAQLSDGPSEPISVPGFWLIFADRTHVGEALASLLRMQGERCVLVSQSDAWTVKNGEHFLMRADDPGDMRQLFNAVLESDSPSCRGIVHLWSLDTPEMSTLDADSLESVEIAACGSVVHLVQNIAQREWTARPRLWLVTRGAQHVLEPSITPASPVQASLWGLGRVAAREHPEFWGGLIDLDPQGDASDLAGRLQREVTTPHKTEQELAFRAGGRYAARLTRWMHPTPGNLRPAFHWRADAAYLITGGLGDVGIQVAQWMVKRGARRLILMGRTPIPPRSDWSQIDPESVLGRKISAILSLETLGASIHPASIDIADEAQLVRFVENFRTENWPPIRGVIHLAGAIEDHLLLQLDVNSLRSVLRSKVLGAWLLHRLFNQVDCFIMFSSIGALLGQVGQGNYAAANAFLDALAAYRQQQGQSALSINWGVWKGLGFAASSGGRQTIRQFELQGIRSFDAEDGLDALGMLLDHGVSDRPVAVIPIDLPTFNRANKTDSRPAWPLAYGLLDQENLRDVQESSAPDRSQKLSFHQQLLDTAPERRGQYMSEYLQNLIGRILRMPVAKIAPDRPFGSFGLDSLMAVEFRNQLESDLGLKLSATLVWNYPTIQRLSSFLTDKLNQLNLTDTAKVDEIPVQAEAGTSKPNKIGALLAEIDDLSDAEAMQSLINKK